MRPWAPRRLQKTPAPRPAGQLSRHAHRDAGARRTAGIHHAIAAHAEGLDGCAQTAEPAMPTPAPAVAHVSALSSGQAGRPPRAHRRPHHESLLPRAVGRRRSPRRPPTRTPRPPAPARPDWTARSARHPPSEAHALVTHAPGHACDAPEASRPPYLRPRAFSARRQVVFAPETAMHRPVDVDRPDGRAACHRR